MKKIPQKIVAVAILLLSVLAFSIHEAVADAGGGLAPGSAGGSGGGGS